MWSGCCAHWPVHVHVYKGTGRLEDVKHRTSLNTGVSTAQPPTSWWQRSVKVASRRGASKPYPYVDPDTAAAVIHNTRRECALGNRFDSGLRPSSLRTDRAGYSAQGVRPRGCARHEAELQPCIGRPIVSVGQTLPAAEKRMVGTLISSPTLSEAYHTSSHYHHHHHHH